MELVYGIHTRYRHDVRRAARWFESPRAQRTVSLFRDVLFASRNHADLTAAWILRAMSEMPSQSFFATMSGGNAGATKPSEPAPARR